MHHASWITGATFFEIAVYTLSDLGVLSNLIGSLSLANDKNRRQNPVWEFTKTIIPFALVGYEVIITNSRYAHVGYFITSYPTRAHWTIVNYSPPTEWIMRKPNKNKMAGVNAWIERSIKSIFNGFLLKMLLRSLPAYILKQLFFSISVNSGRIFCHYSPRFQRIIVNYFEFWLVHCIDWFTVLDGETKYE